MYPITLAGNECLECHLPENATGDDVPLPESHFKAPVMGKGAAHEPMAWVVKDYRQSQDVAGRSLQLQHVPHPAGDERLHAEKQLRFAAQREVASSVLASGSE